MNSSVNSAGFFVRRIQGDIACPGRVCVVLAALIVLGSAGVSAGVATPKTKGPSVNARSNRPMTRLDEPVTAEKGHGHQGAPTAASAVVNLSQPHSFSSYLRTLVPFISVVPTVFVYDVTTRTVLFEKSPDQPCAPSSMTKVMTLHIVFERLKTREMALDEEVTISANAARQEGSRMFLKIGEKVKVRDLIFGVAVVSGNDAATALAEHIAGSEEAFAQIMTDKAQEMGCTNTTFLNASGLPKPGHQSTVRDLAVIACATLRQFPREYAQYYTPMEFTFNGIKQPNRNRLLRDKTADGMKTGFTQDGGYGIIASAQRGKRRVLVVLNGATTDALRISEARRLLNWGFQAFSYVQLYDKQAMAAQVKVWQDAPINAVAAHDIAITVPKRVLGQCRVLVQYKEPLMPPVAKGDVVGHVLIAIKQFALKFPLVAQEDRSGSSWQRLKRLFSLEKTPRPASSPSTKP